MGKIKEIIEEIRSIKGNNAKISELKKHVDNDILRNVLYLTYSPRVKFYIKQIPAYSSNPTGLSLSEALESLKPIRNRELTGSDAINHLIKLLTSLESDDSYILERIVDRSLKFSLGTTFINKVFKDLIEKTPYMGAISFNEDKVKKLFKNGAICKSDIKMDGRYCNAIITNGRVELVSRQGEITYVGNAKFMEELSGIDDCVLNGELTIDNIDRYTANGMIASIVDIEGKKEERGVIETSKKIEQYEKKHGSYLESLNNIVYTVWDVITYSEYLDKKSNVIYSERLINLDGKVKSLVNVRVVESKLVSNYNEAMIHFQEALSRGLEGTILKSLDNGWKNGKPTYQSKMKLEINLDLIIKSFNYGTKGTKNENVISSINVESSCGQLKTSPGGMDEDMMKFVTDNQDNLVDTVIEIRCCGVSINSAGNYSTLHPSVVKIRDDKNESNTLKECIEIDESAKGLI